MVVVVFFLMLFLRHVIFGLSIGKEFSFLLRILVAWETLAGLFFLSFSGFFFIWHGVTWGDGKVLFCELPTGIYLGQSQAVIIRCFVFLGGHEIFGIFWQGRGREGFGMYILVARDIRNNLMIDTHSMIC